MASSERREGTVRQGELALLGAPRCCRCRKWYSSDGNWPVKNYCRPCHEELFPPPATNITLLGPA